MIPLTTHQPTCLVIVPR